MRNRDWFKKLLCTDTDLLVLPIVPSVRLGRTGISVVKIRPAETWKGEEWCWTEVEPVEGE